MKAAFYQTNRTISIAQCIPVPPGPRELQIKVAYGGICGTDLHIYHGKMDWRIGASRIMGHEISGTVAAIGEAVEGFALGDRVTVMPLLPCETCPACLADHGHICHYLKFLGIDTPGGFQERWTVPASTVHKIPDTLSLKHAALIEPIAVACHDLRLSNLKEGDLAVVIGGGPIGALIALMARLTGARVIVSEINPFRRDTLKQLGLETIDPVTGDLPGWVKEQSGGTGADVIFEVTGHPSGIEMTTQLPRTRGTIVIVGIVSEPPKVDLFQVFWRELSIIGARVYEKEDFQRAIRLAACGALPLESLITDTYPLEHLEAGLKQMEQGGKNMKIILQCSDNQP